MSYPPINNGINYPIVNNHAMNYPPGVNNTGTISYPPVNNNYGITNYPAQPANLINQPSYNIY